MQAFLDTFYESVDDWLGDLSVSKRLTKAKKLRDLQVVEKQVWEQVLKICGPESMVTRAEATITVVDGTSFYRLPGGFRQFIGCEKRTGGDRKEVEARLNTIPFTKHGFGIEILSQQQGMMIRPEPDASLAGDWTLIYCQGPVILHHATAAAVGASTITFATPGTDAGTLIPMDDYYNNALVEVYSATLGFPQILPVADYVESTNVATLLYPWNPLPTGTIKYQVRPILPADYDDIFAIEVAIRNSRKRSQSRRGRELKEARRELWSACQNHWASNVADRGPTRTIWERVEVDPYGNS